MGKQIKFNNYRCDLSTTVEFLLKNGKYRACKMIITKAMSENPDAPEPHNLYGIMLEYQGNHSLAMNHFRAAWALDSTYEPAKRNLDSYSAFPRKNKSFFDENDCHENDYKDDDKELCEVRYNCCGIGYIVNKIHAYGQGEA